MQHSAHETDLNLERVIPMAQRLSAVGPKAPILVRLDLLGQRSLLGPDAPLRQSAKRRRVMAQVGER